MTAAPSRRNRPPAQPARREGAARSAAPRSGAGRTSAERVAAGRAGQSALAHAVRLDPAEHADPAAVPARKHLRVAPTISKRVLRQRRRARFAIAGVAAISAISMFLLVTFHVFAVQSSFQLDKLEHRRAAAQRQNELLRNLVATRSSATTIYSAAIEMGMVPVTAVLINLPDTPATIPVPSPTPIRMPPTDYGANVAAVAP